VSIAPSRARGTYRNPIFSRGPMCDAEGRPVLARIETGPSRGCVVQVQHEWTLGRGAIQVGVAMYRLETDEHGFVFVWEGARGQRG